MKETEERWPRMGLRLPPELRELIAKAAELSGMKQGQYCRFVLREQSEAILRSIQAKGTNSDDSLPN